MLDSSMFSAQGEVPGKYRNVIPNFFYWAMNGQPLSITGDGNETRDWTFVGDIINGLLSMGFREDAIGEAINLGSSKEHKVIDMANKINDLTDNDAGVIFTERRNWDVKCRLLSSIGKAKKILDFAPNMSFEDGLESTHKWFADNWNNIKDSAEF